MGKINVDDLETPIPALLDLRVLLALKSLEHGNVEPVLNFIENGRLPYLVKFMTDEDQHRLARQIRTGSPLTQSEKRKTYSAEAARDELIITRICYWKAKGLPLYSHTSKNTAIHYAAENYAESPLSGAPARTAESARKYVWSPLKKGGHPLGNNALRQSLLAFISGLTESEAGKTKCSERFIWFGKYFLQGPAIACLYPAESSLLDRLIDPTVADCSHYRNKVGQALRRTKVISAPADFSGHK